MTPDPIFESLLSHLGSLWGGALGVTFESLLGHFNPFWVSVDLGARCLPKLRADKLQADFLFPFCPLVVASSAVLLKELCGSNLIALCTEILAIGQVCAKVSN